MNTAKEMMDARETLVKLFYNIPEEVRDCPSLKQLSDLILDLDTMEDFQNLIEDSEDEWAAVRTNREIDVLERLTRFYHEKA